MDKRKNAEHCWHCSAFCVNTIKWLTGLAPSTGGWFSVADQVEHVVDQSLKQAERLRQSILKKAFEGKLVEPGFE